MQIVNIFSFTLKTFIDYLLNLFIDLISKWHLGFDEYLGRKLIGPCPPVLIVGIDMPRSRWMPLLGRFGLAEWNDEKGKWFLLKNGPIKGMFTQNEPFI